MLREKMVKLLEARPDALKGRDPATLSDEDIEAAFREAMATPAAPGASAPPVAPDPLAIARQVDAMVGARVHLREAVATSRLPAAAQERVARLVEARGDFSRADVDRAVADERDYLARFVESGRVTDLGGASRIEVGEGRSEKVAAMLDAFFDPAHRDHGQAASFREAYIDITGDRRVTGQVGNCDQGVMQGNRVNPITLVLLVPPQAPGARVRGPGSLRWRSARPQRPLVTDVRATI